jgi:type III pantothenate kinase
MPEKRRARAPRSAVRDRRSAAKHAARSAGRFLIAVDIGNTETVVGLFAGSDLRGFWRLTSGRLTADEASLQLDGLLRRVFENGPAAPRTVSDAVLCSVAPTLTLAWTEALRRLTGAPPVEVSAATATSLPIRYHDKSAVGADRIANALAARRFYGTPAIVVDLGTATTFDCISRQGAYLGGVIAPGVATSAEELFRRAARLPRVELRTPARALGRSTEESLQAGVIWGTAGQVDALVRRLALEMKGTPHVIATGGFARTIAEHCETINRVDEALTLKGMRLLWEERT